jgi:hypothetical protein
MSLVWIVVLSVVWAVVALFVARAVWINEKWYKEEDIGEWTRKQVDASSIGMAVFVGVIWPVIAVLGAIIGPIVGMFFLLRFLLKGLFTRRPVQWFFTPTAARKQQRQHLRRAA